MNKVKIINTYWKLKKVHDLLSNGDWNDPRTELIKESISIEEMDRINEILRECEDMGIQYLEREQN